VLTMEDFPLPPLRRTRRIATDVGSYLATRSALFRIVAWSGLLSPRLFLLPEPPPPPDGVVGMPLDVYRRNYPRRVTEAWRITRGLVLMLRNDVERHGARFAVVVINGHEEVSEERWKLLRAVNPELAAVPLDRDKPDRLIRRFLARRGITTIPLLEVFR